MSKRKGQYVRYLASGHWKQLRHKAFKRDGFQCILCGSKTNLNGHHKKYRRDLDKCTVDDIETLCLKCHEAHHLRKREFRKINRQLRLTTIILYYSAEGCPDPPLW